MSESQKNLCRHFFKCAGLIMAISELWKQLYLTYFLNHGTYNWWYFPFQLCSIPMYVLLALPFVRSDTIRRILLSFLMCFGLLGGVAVFADTSGLHYPAAVLTVHSYAWHILLILLGIAAGIVFIIEETPLRRRLFSFLGACGLYLFCCVIASLINYICTPLGEINMFYINPRYRMNQVVFCRLVPFIGNTAAILVYICATILGAFLLAVLWQIIFMFYKQNHFLR